MATLARSRVTKEIAAAGNYSAGDIVCENATTGTAWAFENLTPHGSGHVGIIYKADITCDEDSITASYRLHLFSKNIVSSELRDNVAKAFDNDDRLNYLGAITFPAMVDEGEYSRAQVDGLTIGYWTENSANTLYGVLEDLSGETNETAGMDMTITLWAA